MVRIFARISLLVFAALVPAAASLYAQPPAEKMKAKVDSLREAALKPQPRQEERRDSIKLQSIDPKMDAAIDSLLSIPVDSSIFKGEYISLSAIEIEDLCQKGRLYAEEYDFDEAFNCFGHHCGRNGDRHDKPEDHGGSPYPRHRQGCWRYR